MADDSIPDGEEDPPADAENGAQRALMNLILLAHAEIRALRDLVALLLPAESEDIAIHAGNWAVVEAELRRRHLEALRLPLGEFDALVSAANEVQARAAVGAGAYINATNG